MLFYTLKVRQFLQYSTVSYIEQFLTMLEDSVNDLPTEWGGL